MTPLEVKEKWYKLWCRVGLKALNMVVHGQLSGNYEMHMRYSKVYMYCKRRLGEP